MRFTVVTDVPRPRPRPGAAVGRFLAIVLVLFPLAAVILAVAFGLTLRIWQDVVVDLAERSTAILIDVSEPTSNVLWEIERLTAGHPDRCVLVGDAARLRHLATGELSDPAEIRLAELNAGRTVLAYTADRRGIRRFRSALRRMLIATAPSRALGLPSLRGRPFPARRTP